MNAPPKKERPNEEDAVKPKAESVMKSNLAEERRDKKRSELRRSPIKKDGSREKGGGFITHRIAPRDSTIVTLFTFFVVFMI